MIKFLTELEKELTLKESELDTFRQSHQELEVRHETLLGDYKDMVKRVPSTKPDDEYKEPRSIEEIYGSWKKEVLGGNN